VISGSVVTDRGDTMYMVAASGHNGTTLLTLRLREIQGGERTAAIAYHSFLPNYWTAASGWPTNNVMLFVKYEVAECAMGRTELGMARAKDLLLVDPEVVQHAIIKVWDTPDAHWWNWKLWEDWNADSGRFRHGVWQTSLEDQSGKYRPRLQFVQLRDENGKPNRNKGLVAFTDFSPSELFSLPQIRFVQFDFFGFEDGSETPSLAVKSLFLAEKLTTDFMLTHRDNVPVLVTAETNRLTVDIVDLTMGGLIEAQVITGPDIVMSNVGKQSDFLGQTDVISVLEVAGKRKAVAFYKSLGTMGYRLLRRVYYGHTDDATASDYNLVQHNSRQGVLSHLIVAGGNELKLLNGDLGDISSLPRKLECVEPSLEYPMEPDNHYCAANRRHTNCRYTHPNPYCSVLEEARHGLTDVQKQWLLNAHNELRSNITMGYFKDDYGLLSASGMTRLTWDEELARTAQNWASQCKYEYDEDRGKLLKDGTLSPVWQSVMVHTASSKFQMEQHRFESVVGTWFKEVEAFKGGDVQDYQFDKKYGHFAQISWAKTSKVGCGWVYFHDEKAKKHRFVSLTVCNYWVKGNTDGEVMYKEGEPCSGCKDKARCLEDPGNLCEELKPVIIPSH